VSRYPGLAVGPFGLGTAPLAGLYAPVDEEEAAGALAAAWAGGVRFFDTAPHYGAGVAERRLGEFLRTRPRGEAIVSTKVGRRLVPGPARPGDEAFYVDGDLVRVRDYSRDGVRRSLEDSLARSGLDRFDLALIHDPDEHWEQAIGRAYPALAELRDAGVVDAIGVGMNQCAMLARFVRESDVDMILVAGRYTLLDREAADDLLPLCAERDVSVVVGGVFNSGVLADPRDGAHFDYAPADATVLARARALREICAAHGVPLAAAALAFPRRHPAVATILVGARSGAEVAEDLALSTVDIPEALWADLEAM
jgi:aryl-alcohol dehydrogenase-like predicted oxidoreductase